MARTRRALREPVLLPLLILLGLIWLLPNTSVPSLLHTQVSRQYSQLPKVKLDLHPTRTFRNRYSANKTAVYMETRPHIRHMTPLLLHMIEVVPPEWRFVFLGTDETAQRLNTSSPVRRYQEWGKLRVGTIEAWAKNWGKEDVGIDELHSRLLTNSTFYEMELRGTEHLLVFHSDAVFCANSNRDVNEFLEWDWVGAPWNLEDRFGGNGGLSLRRVSKVLEVLQFQTRLDNTFSEDQWMASRVGLVPGANMAPPAVEREFAVEDIWTERPMGYHINPTVGPGNSADVWDDPAKRRMIYEYCPEIKIILDMRLDREQCVLPDEGPLEGDPEYIIPDPQLGIEGEVPYIMADPLAGSGPQGPREDQQVLEIIPHPVAGSNFEQAMLAEQESGVMEAGSIMASVEVQPR